MATRNSDKGKQPTESSVRNWEERSRRNRSPRGNTSGLPPLQAPMLPVLSRPGLQPPFIAQNGGQRTWGPTLQTPAGRVPLEPPIVVELQTSVAKMLNLPPAVPDDQALAYLEQLLGPRAPNLPNWPVVRHPTGQRSVSSSTIKKVSSLNERVKISETCQTKPKEKFIKDDHKVVTSASSLQKEVKPDTIGNKSQESIKNDYAVVKKTSFLEMKGNASMLSKLKEKPLKDDYAEVKKAIFLPERAKNSETNRMESNEKSLEDRAEELAFLEEMWELPEDAMESLQIETKRAKIKQRWAALKDKLVPLNQ